MTQYTGKVAAVVIPRTDEGLEYLVAKRADNGEWEFPGGKQEKGETVFETAEREIREEFSLEIEASRIKQSYSWKGGGYDIIPVLADHNYKDLENQLEQREMSDHSEHEWIRPEDLGNNLDSAREKLGEEIKALKAFDFL